MKSVSKFNGDHYKPAIIFVSKQVICPATAKPVCSDKTCFSIMCLYKLLLWSSNKLKHSIFVHKLCYLVFTLDHKCPVTVSDQAKIFPVKI